MKAQLREAMKSAMKAQEKLRLETIRAVLSALQYEEMQKGVDELPAAECTAVVQREVKKRVEGIEFAEKANRPESKEQLLKEIAILEEFLPKMLSAEELEKIVSDFKSATPEISLGLVMKHLKDTYAGQYDGKVASEVAKRVVG